MSPRTKRRIFAVALILDGLILTAGALAGEARACDPGQYYDPTHQICAGSPPAYPRPGYGPWDNNYPSATNSPGRGWGGS